MDAAAITRSLELVAERGDPAAMVYARVFAAHPEMEKLFVRDTNGLVRGNMLAETVSAILDFVDCDTYGGNLMRIEIVNHENLGVPREVFAVFFSAMRDAFAETLGSEWTSEIDAAWSALLCRVAGVSRIAPLPVLRNLLRSETNSNFRPIAYGEMKMRRRKSHYDARVCAGYRKLLCHFLQ